MGCALFTNVQIVTDQEAPAADQPFADGTIIQTQLTAFRALDEIIIYIKWANCNRKSQSF